MYRTPRLTHPGIGPCAGAALALAAALALLASALAPSAASAQSVPAATKRCDTKAAAEIARDLQRTAQTILRKAAQPGARPEDWALDVAELLADATSLTGVCHDADRLLTYCPFCALEDGAIPLDVHTAPAVLASYVARIPNVFDPRAAGARTPEVVR